MSSGDDISDVPMEVDEPATPGPTTPKSIPPSTPPRLSISETDVQTLGTMLGGLLALPTFDPRLGLRLVHSTVTSVLSQDKTINTRLADEDQFRKNVEEKGMESFTKLLRDINERKSWRDLLENGTYCLRLISSTLIVPCFQRYF